MTLSQASTHAVACDALMNPLAGCYCRVLLGPAASNAHCYLRDPCIALIQCVAGWETQQQWLASSTKQAASEAAAALMGLELKESMLQSYTQAA